MIVSCKFILSALIIFSTLVAFAETDKPIKLGVEIELLPPTFANLVDLFDFGSLPPKVKNQVHQTISEEAVDRYLEHRPENFFALPEEFQEKLSAGLQIKRPTLHTPSGLPPSRERKIILPNDVHSQPSSSSRPPGSRLIIPNKPLNVPDPRHVLRESVTSTALPNQIAREADWAVVVARWKKMDHSERLALVQFDRVDRLEKARAIIESPEAIKEIKIREDLPAEERRFWRKFNFHLEGSAIEFKHAVPVSSETEFIADVRKFSQRAGIESKIFDPKKANDEALAQIARELASIETKFKRPATSSEIREAYNRQSWGSIHFHGSRPGAANLKPLATHWNNFLLVDRVADGNFGDLQPKGNYKFSPDLRDKGLVRFGVFPNADDTGVDLTRVETRLLVEPLDQAVMRFSRWSALDPDALRTESGREIARKLDNGTVDLFLREKPEYLIHVIESLPKEEADRIFQYAQSSSLPKAKKFFPQKSSESFNFGDDAALDLFKSHPQYNARIWSTVQKAIDGDPELITQTFMHTKDLGETQKNQLKDAFFRLSEADRAGVISKLNPDGTLGLLDGISNQKWPNSEKTVTLITKKLEQDEKFLYQMILSEPQDAPTAHILAKSLLARSDADLDKMLQKFGPRVEPLEPLFAALPSSSAERQKLAEFTDRSTRMFRDANLAQHLGANLHEPSVTEESFWKRTLLSEPKDLKAASLQARFRSDASVLFHIAFSVNSPPIARDKAIEIINSEGAEDLREKVLKRLENEIGTFGAKNQETLISFIEKSKKTNPNIVDRILTMRLSASSACN